MAIVGGGSKEALRDVTRETTKWQGKWLNPAMLEASKFLKNQKWHLFL